MVIHAYNPSSHSRGKRTRSLGCSAATQQGLDSETLSQTKASNKEEVGGIKKRGNGKGGGVGRIKGGKRKAGRREGRE